MRAKLLALALSVGCLSLFGDPARGTLSPREAEATTSVLMTLEELVSVSQRICVVVPEERTSRWEQVGESKRIVTYTKLSVKESWLGSEVDAVWVRTLGGKVDKIGQQVAGEAALKLGERAVVFLVQTPEATLVTGMAQGHFPLVMVDGEERLASSPDTGTLLPKRGPRVSARERLLGRALAKVQGDIASVIKAQRK